MAEVTIYTLEQCPHCKSAKNLLSQNGIEFKEVLTKADDVCTRTELEEKTGMKTFPQIFFGNKVIGGFSDLKELDTKVGIKNAFR